MSRADALLLALMLLELAEEADDGTPVPVRWSTTFRRHGKRYRVWLDGEISVEPSEQSH